MYYMYYHVGVFTHACIHTYAELIETIKELGEVAEEIGCSLSQLAIAWCIKNTNVSTVIIGR